MEKAGFANEGVLVRRKDDQVSKTVLSLDRQLTGTWTAEQLVDREIKALRLLHDVRGVPKYLSRESPTSFSMTHIDGVNLLDSRLNINADYFPRLRTILKEMADRGVYRFGQSRRDYLVQPDGSPGVIDFGNVCFADENPAIAQAARMWNTLRIADLERRFRPIDDVTDTVPQAT